MVAAQGDELLADGAAVVGLLLAAHSVGHHALHLVARLHVAVGVAALAGVHQRGDAALDGLAPRLLGVFFLVRAAQLADLLVAWRAQVKVL